MVYEIIYGFIVRQIIDFFTALGCLYLFYCLGIKRLKKAQKRNRRNEKAVKDVLREDEDEDEYDEEEEDETGSRQQISLSVNEENPNTSKPLMMGQSIELDGVDESLTLMI